MPEYIYDQIKFILLGNMPEPNRKVDAQIKYKDGSLGYQHLYGTVMSDDKTIYYIIFIIDV